MDKPTITDTLDTLDQQSLSERIADLIERDDGVKNSESKRKLRHWLQYFLLSLLTIEILFLIYIIISQGIKHLLFTSTPFLPNEWSFGSFCNIALLQTFFLIRPIANNLFPKQPEK